MLRDSRVDDKDGLRDVVLEIVYGSTRLLRSLYLRNFSEPIAERSVHLAEPRLVFERKQQHAGFFCLKSHVQVTYTREGKVSRNFRFNKAKTEVPKYPRRYVENENIEIRALVTKF